MLKRSAIWTVVAAAVLAAAGGVLLVLWQGPWWVDGGPLTDKDLTGPAATLITGFRTTLVQVLIALGAVMALVFTWRNYRLTRRGQVTDRFIKALERLGSEELYVRYGGVLALEQIVKDAPDQATHAAQVLGAFIRHRAPQRPAEPVPPAEKLRLPDRPDEDVQAALTALTRPASRRHVHRDERIDLSNQHLAGARLNGADLAISLLTGVNLAGAPLNGAELTDALLEGADLTGAWLRGADLTAAWLYGADLTRALLDGANLTDTRLNRVNLTDAKLIGTLLHGADLTGAGFYRADLTRARLDGANLTDAVLNRADLTLAEGLTVDQVVSARPDHTTQLPAAIAADPAMGARIEQLAAEREAAAESRSAGSAPAAPQPD
jgi:hypothetical protein